MTKREFFKMVIDAQAISEEMVEFAEAEIKKLDERNAKRAGEQSKRQKENEPIKKAIRELLGAEPKVASEIAEALEISTQKASALLKQIDGVVVTEVKIKGKGKVKGYALAEEVKTE